MNPRLIAISGSQKGTVFSLLEDEISVGRESSNTVCINDSSVSRRHCLLRHLSNDSQATAPEVECQPTQDTTSYWRVIDLESFNGTFVNGIPVKEQTVAHGDHLAVGDVILLFVLHDFERASGTAAVQLDEADLITRSTVRLRCEDALYLRPDKVIAELPATARIARDLITLLRISSSINLFRDSNELQMRLLGLIQEVVPAEREAILLVNTNRAGFSSVCGWSKLKGHDNSLKVSATITKQVLLEGVALLCNDLIDNQSYRDSQSLVTGRICSVLCVPLVVFEKTLGVIYLDTSDPSARFDEGHRNC